MAGDAMRGEQKGLETDTARNVSILGHLQYNLEKDGKRNKHCRQELDWNKQDIDTVYVLYVYIYDMIYIIYIYI